MFKRKRTSFPRRKVGRPTSGKRRRYSLKKRLTKRKARVPVLFPKTKICKFTHSEVIALSPGDLTAVINQNIRPCAVADPMYNTDDTHQPQQYDKAMEIYDSARVISTKITVRAIPTAATTSSLSCSYWNASLGKHCPTSGDDDILQGKTLEQIMMMDGQPKPRLISSLGASTGGSMNNTKVIHFDAKKWFHDRDYMMLSAAQEALYNNGPNYDDAGSRVSQPKVKIYCVCPNGNGATQRFIVKQEFTCLLYDRLSTSDMADADQSA